MALIICEECGKQISDRAAACIHCGCPITKNTVKNPDTSNVRSEPVTKRTTNEFWDKNTRRLIVEFDAVVSNKPKESAINTVFVRELGKHVELFVPNNIKTNEKIWKKIDHDPKCDLIIFTVKSISVDPSVQTIANAPKSKRKAAEPTTIHGMIKHYRQNAFARFFDGPAVGCIIVPLALYTFLQEIWYAEVFIVLAVIAIPLIAMKIFYPFHHAKKYISKHHIDDAIKNDPDSLSIAILTYKLMPCRKMLRYIKKLNSEAGLEIERQLRKK